MKFFTAATVMAVTSSLSVLSLPATATASASKSGKVGKASKAAKLAHTFLSYGESYSYSMSVSPTPTPTPFTISCREDLYIMSTDETVTNKADDGLTIKTFAPLYGYNEEGFPDYSKYIGQYSSVDTLIPVGIGEQYTCQQSSFVGVNFDGMWYADQVTGFGICVSSGPGNAWEGNVGVSGGLGIYEGATGMMRWECWGNCTLAVNVCVLDAVQN